MKMIRELEHITFEKMLMALTLSSLEGRNLMGNCPLFSTK